MAEVTSNSSFAHPSAVQSADQPFQTLVNTVGGLGKTLEGVSGWQVFFTIVLLSITYDQCLWLPLSVLNGILGLGLTFFPSQFGTFGKKEALRDPH